MPTFKTTFFFESFQPGVGVSPGAAVGWTETWYRDAGGIDQALTDGLVDNYTRLRRACLATVYKIQWCRVASVDNPRLTKIRNLGNQIGASNGDPAQVNCCLLVDCTALPSGADTLSHHRRFLMRGLTVNDIDGNVFFARTRNMQAITAFLNHVANGTIDAPSLPVGILPAWQIRGLPSTAMNNPITSLTAVQPAGLQLSVVSPGLSGTTGQKVLFRGVKFPYFINRVWTDQGPGLAGARILGKSRKHIAGDWNGTGQLVTFSYVYRGANQYLIMGLRNRQTGRPSHLTRGKRNPVI